MGKGRPVIDRGPARGADAPRRRAGAAQAAPPPPPPPPPKRRATWPYVLVMLGAWGLIFGGLFFSHFLTLYITPTFYVSMARMEAALRRRRARFA